MDNEPSYLFSSGLATILYQSEAEQAEQCIVFCQGSWGGGGGNFKPPAVGSHSNTELCIAF